VGALGLLCGPGERRGLLVPCLRHGLSGRPEPADAPGRRTGCWRGVVLGAGAEWIWIRAAHFVGGPGVEVVAIVDLYHADEHLWAMGRAGTRRGGQCLGRAALATPSIPRARPPCWPLSTRSSRLMPRRPSCCSRRPPTVRTPNPAGPIR